GKTGQNVGAGPGMRCILPSGTGYYLYLPENCTTCLATSSSFLKRSTKAEFRDLLPAIAEHFAACDLMLLTFDKSSHQGALWLKWATQMGPGAGRKVVLWLPYAREEL